MIALFCPGCRGPLTEEPRLYRCGACGTEYPVVAGIPDLRLYDDPYISIEDDRRKALYLAERARTLSFVELLAHYYEITPEVSPGLAARYAGHQAAALERGAAILERLERHFARALAPDEKLLDLGCGVAGLVGAATRQGATAVGVDIALRWLVVARSLLEEAGMAATLVCACADHLPFAPGSFDVVVAEALLEHVAGAGDVLVESQRVLAPHGRLMARSVNRLCLGPEPHLDLWWAGYLPPTLRNRYARWRRGRDYSRLHLRSPGEMRRLVARPDLSLRLVPALLLDGDLAHRSPLQQALLRAYGRIRRLPVLGRLADRVGPYIEIVSAR